MKKLFIQIIKFGIVGVIATIIDYLFFTFFNEILNIHPTISTGLSFIISLIANYLLSMKFVFKAKENLSKHKEIIIFVFTSCVGFGINILMMHVGHTLWEISEYIVKIVATAVVMIWNYVSKKLLLEGRDNKNE